MPDREWTVTEVVQAATYGKHKTTVLGLKVSVSEETYGVSWQARGWLDEYEVDASRTRFNHEIAGVNRADVIEDAKAYAVAAARRLYMAGVRGEKGKTPSLNYRVRPEGSGWAVTDIAGDIVAIYPSEDEAWEEAAAWAWITEAGEAAKAGLARVETPPVEVLDPAQDPVSEAEIAESYEVWREAHGVEEAAHEELRREEQAEASEHGGGEAF